MATQGIRHGAVQNFPFFFTFVPVLFVCIFVQSDFNIQHLLFYMFVKFDMIMKNNLENIEMLSLEFLGFFFE